MVADSVIRMEKPKQEGVGHSTTLSPNPSIAGRMLHAPTHRWGTIRAGTVHPLIGELEVYALIRGWKEMVSVGSIAPH